MDQLVWMGSMKSMATIKLLCVPQKTREPREQRLLQEVFHLQGKAREAIALFYKCTPKEL